MCDLFYESSYLLLTLFDNPSLDLQIIFGFVQIVTKIIEF